MWVAGHSNGRRYAASKGGRIVSPSITDRQGYGRRFTAATIVAMPKMKLHDTIRRLRVAWNKPIEYLKSMDGYALRGRQGQGRDADSTLCPRAHAHTYPGAKIARIHHDLSRLERLPSADRPMARLTTMGQNFF